MSYGTAYSSLFVICDSTEQTTTLIQKFAQDDPGEEFVACQNAHKPLEIQFDLKCGDVSRSFDDHVIKLDAWLCKEFQLSLSGYWLLEADGEWRCEIHNGEVVDACLDWLCSYSIEKIKKIRQYAESSFPHISKS